ncbi:MAG: redox-sensing transcriptional repressor Rex [Anaerolineae bacterium]|nr:redox-sensing transcriptional repressor Rex [Anaerolineae bacterium]
MRRRARIPKPCLARLPVYYRRVLRALEEGKKVISSQELGQAAGVPAAQVRKDLSHIGELGRAGIGYETQMLAATLQEFLGLTNDKEAIIVGAGNLGRALAAYPGFERYGLRIVALFDHNPNKIGTTIAGKKVYPLEKMEELVRQWNVQIGILTVPSSQAQAVADLMVQAGIEVIWNFAPFCLQVPPHVLVENEDLAARLATISYHIARRRALSQLSGVQSSD